MSKTEISRQLATASNAKRLEHLATQIETLRQVKVQSAEDLSAILEPLAQAMAALTDETRETLAQIEATSQQQAQQFQDRISATMQHWTQTLNRAEQAAQALAKAAHQTQAMLIVLALATGIASATLTSAFWLWLAPTPTLVHPIDAQEVANLLKADPTAPPAPSKGKPKR
jgi:nucleotide-binding universal stress UspA family protein